MRIAIAGYPRSGKTTLAQEMAEKDGVKVVRHTDDVMEMGWSESSEHASTWFDAEGPWIIEGVAVPRALRKWLARNPEGKPCEMVAFQRFAHEELTQGQKTMAKGCDTVFMGILEDLTRRGTVVVFNLRVIEVEKAPATEAP